MFLADTAHCCFSELSPCLTLMANAAKKRRIRGTPISTKHRLEFWRKARKLSRQALADKVPCHMQTIRKLEDDTMVLDDVWRERLATPLNILPSDLLPLEFNPKGVEPMRLIPVVAWASAGKPMDVLAEYIDEHTERVAVTNSSLTLLATRVVGSSMDRVAAEGTFAVYDYEDKVLVDKLYYLIRLNGETTFKRYRESAGPPRFEPDSSESHDTIYPSGEVEIIGRVIEVVRKL